jgi:hypoxanthine-DNA glycosylase
VFSATSAVKVFFMLLKGLPPIIDERARVLILGSFPSEASLTAQHYYAHRQNQFWRVLSAVFDLPLLDFDYAAKQAAVKAAGVAIWDVYGACKRQGSLDSAIRAGEPNRFEKLKRLAPGLRRVCFNGRAAAKFEPALALFGYQTFVLPSTSPAYTLSFDAKLARWRQALAG